MDEQSPTTDAGRASPEVSTAECLVTAAPNLFKAQASGWSRPDVAAVVRSITIETLGLKPGQYREDARFVEDLGGG